MPQQGSMGGSVTGLFRTSWTPKKAVTVLWRRVETISPDAYAELMRWVQARETPSVVWPSLMAMTTNEVTIEPTVAIAELTRLLQQPLPAALHEQAELLRDLIWEASDPNSNWLHWLPCRVCGRRWATADYEGVMLCPGHANPAALIAHWRTEMQRYPGLIDHTARIARLEVQAATPALPLRLGAANGSHADEGPATTLPAVMTITEPAAD